MGNGQFNPSFWSQLAKEGAKTAAVVAASRVLKPKTPKIRPLDTGKDAREAAEAADRERRRRAASGSRGTILTGPLGAVDKPLVQRTVLSGGG